MDKKEKYGIFAAAAFIVAGVVIGILIMLDVIYTTGDRGKYVIGVGSIVGGMFIAYMVVDQTFKSVKTD